MRTRQLECFIRVCELGSLTKASQVLNIAQPALGLQLSALDREFGARLLERSVHGTRPTQAGLMFLDEARSMIDRVQRLKQSLQDLDGGGPQTVTLGLTPSLTTLLAARLLEGTIKGRSPVRLKFVEELSNNMVERVEAQKVDLALCYDPPPSALYCAEPKMRELLYLVFKPGSPFDGTDPVALRDVGNLDFVMPHEGDLLRNSLEQKLCEANVALRVGYSIDSMPAIISVIERGLAYGFLPRAVVETEVARGTLGIRPFADPRMTRTMYLVRPKPVRCSPAIDSVMRAIDMALRDVGRLTSAYEPL